MYIRKIGIFLTMAVLTLMMSCRDGGQMDSRKGYLNDELKLKGDMTVNGRACEGCSDSVIGRVPNDGRDPVRYDSIDAMRKGKVLGKPKVGDWMGLVVNSEDSTVADLVIDLDQLKGTWCYIVMPKMRGYE